MKKIQTLEKKRRNPTSTGKGQTEPTPRPWIWVSGDLAAGVKCAVVSESENTDIAYVGCMGQKQNVAESDAELICRAVNSHDALVKAAQAIVACEYGVHPGQLYQHAIAEARKALALAGQAPSVLNGNENKPATQVIP